MKTLAWMARNTHQLGSKQGAEPPVGRRLVVAERGASNLEAALAETAFEQTVVVTTTPAEAPTGLPLRVAARTALAERRGEGFSSATLVLGPVRNAQVLAARELMAHQLVTHLSATGGGDLGLVAASIDDRDDLLLLVDKLLRALDTRDVTIRVQFRGAKRRDHGNEHAPARPLSEAS